MMRKSDARQEGRHARVRRERVGCAVQPLDPYGLNDSAGLRLPQPDLPDCGPFWTTIHPKSVTLIQLLEY